MWGKMAIASRTKNVAVYNRLRQAVIKGKLKPGQKLVMADLAKSFGLSETPVREAIRRLESEGYVDFTPHTGAVVTEIDERQIVEIYLIRTELEALAARLAGPHVTERDIDFLVRKNAEMESAAREGRYESLGALNKEFHLRIYKAAPFPRLYRMICDLWDTFQRWPSVFSYVPERALASVEEHKRIVEALRTRDQDLTDRLVKAQKERTMEALKKYIARKE
ncbi:MAG: GntR family transcriptional regulator [Deltaproteobacteria bacterium]|nr:GntR family transcriptional regulator [Deltaproteobacteria bacterium]